jgi:glucose/arabinose dehydrogenase
MSSHELEGLEARQLFATLPAGFSEKVITRVVTNVAATMTFAPDGRLFVGDTTNGQIHIVKNGVVLPTPALQLSVDHAKERGINGIVLAPDFATAAADKKYVYVYYTRPDPANPNIAPSNANNRLSRFAMSASDADVIDPASETILLDNIESAGTHNGGFLRFDSAGYLYLAVGDNSSSSNAQTLTNLHGKVLRLNVADPANLIPPDNPFVNTAGARGEIWALGLRNPFTGDIKPGTNTLYINDVGQGTWEEINNITRGANYGWPTAEGISNNPDFTNPLYAYNHNGGNAAITGGAFYTATQFPASYQNDYFFADYILKKIWTYDTGTGTVTPFATNTTSIVDLDVSPIDGSLWYLELGGNITEITYNQVPPPPPPPPPPAQSPFKGTPFAIGSSTTSIQVEDFDNGGEGVAYHDVNTANLGGKYRTNVGVDIQTTTDSGGGYNIGYVKTGEWLEYTINVAASGNYDFAFRVASAGSNGKFHFEIDGADKSGQLTIPNTGGWQNWTTINKTAVALTSGQHVLRLFMDAAGTTGSVGNFNYITVKPTTTSTSKTLRPTQDTYVYDASKGANFGNDTKLLVKKNNTGYNRETYLKFDLSSATTIDSAKLRLYGGFDYDPGKSVRFAVYSVSPSAWTESALNWNNKPTSSGPLATITLSGSTKSYKEWDLTSFVKAEKTAGRNVVSFVIKALDASNPIMTFASDEAAANQPQLVIS